MTLMSLCHLPHKFLSTKAINQYLSLTQQKLSPLLVVTLLQQSASAASPRTDTWAELREHCSSCQCREDWDPSAWQHLPFHARENTSSDPLQIWVVFQILVPYHLTFSLLSKTPYFSLQEWFSGSEEVPEDWSSCMSWLFSTASGIQNLQFVYWYHDSPSTCMTPFLPLGHKLNGTSFIIFLFGKLSKHIPGDLLQLHQKIMALSAIKIKLISYLFLNTKSASLPVPFLLPSSMTLTKQGRSDLRPHPETLVHTWAGRPKAPQEPTNYR